MWGFFVASISLVTSQMNCDVLVRDEPFATLPFPQDLSLQDPVGIRTDPEGPQDPKGRTGSDAT